MARIYVASSWRNTLQPEIVSLLRADGHTVYDFKNPAPATGFQWEEVDLPKGGPSHPTVAEYKKALSHQRSLSGFTSDYRAMEHADICALILPCGRSAHLELGWCAGRGKKTVIMTQDGEEPELMALLATEIVGDSWALRDFCRRA